MRRISSRISLARDCWTRCHISGPAAFGSDWKVRKLDDLRRSRSKEDPIQLNVACKRREASEFALRTDVGLPNNGGLLT